MCADQAPPTASSLLLEKRRWEKTGTRESSRDINASLSSHAGAKLVNVHLTLTPEVLCVCRWGDVGTGKEPEAVTGDTKCNSLFPGLSRAPKGDQHGPPLCFHFSAVELSAASDFCFSRFLASLPVAAPLPSPDLLWRGNQIAKLVGTVER